MPSPIQCNNSVKEADFASNEVANNLNFLQRDLAKQEIQACEISAHRYIDNDSFEIEIHNLNEINEYFRIFKDIILKNTRTHGSETERLQQHIWELQCQLGAQTERNTADLPSEALMSSQKRAQNMDRMTSQCESRPFENQRRADADLYEYLHLE
jgi:hypothetical protein